MRATPHPSNNYVCNTDLGNMNQSPTFHPFANLPLELRLKVWNYTLPGPRVVPVRFNRTFLKYTSNSTQPPLLHACPESRRYFLSRYTKLILSQKYDSCIFVDFALDTIFFDTLECSPDGDLAMDLATSLHSEKILSCAIDAHLWEILRVFRYDSLSEVRSMQNLKTIALVLPRDYDQWPSESQREGTFIEVDSSMARSEIHHMHFYVESLRWELEHGVVGNWGNGTPNVQMWLW